MGGGEGVDKSDRQKLSAISVCVKVFCPWLSKKTFDVFVYISAFIAKYLVTISQYLCYYDNILNLALIDEAFFLDSCFTHLNHTPGANVSPHDPNVKKISKNKSVPVSATWQWRVAYCSYSNFRQLMILLLILRSWHVILVLVRWNYFKTITVIALVRVNTNDRHQ